MNTTLTQTSTLPKPQFRLAQETWWTGLGLLAILVLAAVLRFSHLDAIGDSNTYYTAAIKSMLQSWHNFFYVAAEPGGSVSIDKPPLGLWLEALSAYFLGVSGFATVLPNLLAGLGAVALVFHLVRRSFGNLAGLVAALVLAVTPVAIAVERNNTQDGMLMFILLLAAWAFIKATETRQIRYLFGGAVLVGLGFNVKMMQAFLPLPAFYALYFLGSEQGWWRKLLHLGLTTLVVVVVSLSWAIAVDLTPADQRPYVGSSENNSVLNLLLGYNGLERLTGMTGGGSGDGARPNAGSDDGQFPPPNDGQPNPSAFGDDGNGTPPTGGPNNAGGMFGTGQAGVLRMFQSGLAAQVSWLLPFGLLMLGLMALSTAWWRPHTALHRGLILWGLWLLTCVVFFSVAEFFHQYYLIMLGAPLAALVGMGVTYLWRRQVTHPRSTVAVWVFVAGVTMAFQIYAVVMYQSLRWWMVLPIGLGGLGLGLLLGNLRWARPVVARLSLALMVGALVLTPAIWSGLTTAYADVQGPMPQAYSGGIQTDRGNGPDGANMAGPTNAGGQSVNQALLEYLQTDTQDTKYLLVVPSSTVGSNYVLATGRPVLYAGGFNGNDSVIDATDLQQLVAEGEVRYVLWSTNGGPGGNTKTDITSYLQTACTLVTETNLTAANNIANGRGEASTLYKCSP